MRQRTLLRPDGGSIIDGVTSAISDRIVMPSQLRRRHPRDTTAQPADMLLATGIEALVCVRTGPATSPERFAGYLATEPSVVEAWQVAADIDVIVRLACPSLTELEAVVARMRHLAGAEHTVTHLVLPSGITPAVS